MLGLWVPERAVSGIGFLATLAIVFMAGYASSKWLGQSIYAWIQNTLLRSKLTRSIYGTIHHTLSAIFGDKKVFNQVAIIDFPQLGYKRIGFVTQETLGIPDLDKKGMVVVYCPHSFQVSGNMFIVPAKNIQLIDMPAETALKLIMSAGMVSDQPDPNAPRT
jgi:uncharacterized membrane protein